MPSSELDIGALSTSAGTFARAIWPTFKAAPMVIGYYAVDAVGGLARRAELPAIHIDAGPRRVGRAEQHAVGAGVDREPHGRAVHLAHHVEAAIVGGGDGHRVVAGRHRHRRDQLGILG